MQNKVKIENTIIGTGYPPFTVAEAGINHNGNIDTALKMISVAKRSGVNAIKFQTFKAEEFVSDPNQMITYKTQDKEITESMLEMFRRCEFTKEDWFKIKKKCNEEKIIFFSSPQNKTDLDLLLEVGVPAIKVGSDDFTNTPLLKDYSSTGLPMIISCGMSDLGEIFESLNALGSFDGYPTILLLTTSLYPTTHENVNLSRIGTLSTTFPMIPIGFSDHTQGALASSLAVASGACLIEKHFTLDRALPGPDHWFAEDPTDLKTWVDSIKKSFTIMGSKIMKPVPSEEEIRIIARRSIVAIRDISVGEQLDRNNIGLKRPGNGLPSKMLNQVIGLKATRKIQNGTMLKFGDFA